MKMPSPDDDVFVRRNTLFVDFLLYKLIRNSSTKMSWKLKTKKFLLTLLHKVFEAFLPTFTCLYAFKM